MLPHNAENEEVILQKRLLREDALSSPWAFSKWVKTKDEHDAENPVKPFPQKEYIKYSFETMQNNEILFIPKSRQLLYTWMICIYALWLAKKYAHRLIFVQGKKEEDAAVLVFSGGIGKNWDVARISFMEKHLPSWLQDNVEPSSAPSKLIFPATGSVIQAIPQGGDIVRSKVPSLIVSDEAAFQPEFDAAYTAMLPITKQGGQLIALSSAEAGFFYDTCGDMDIGQPDDIKGIKTYTTQEGVKIMRAHYSADPDKDPDTPEGAAWREREAKGYPGGIHDPRWRKEMEVDVDAYTGQLLFPFLFQHEKSILVNPFEVSRSWPLTAGFDYGARNPSAFMVTVWDEGFPVTIWEYYEVPRKKSETDEDFKARKGYKNTARAIKNCPYFDRVMSMGGIAADPSLWAVNQQTQNGLKSMADLFEQEGVILFPASRGGDITFFEMISNNFWQNPLEPKWKIFRTCTWLWWELLRLRFAERAASANAVHNLKDEIVDKNNHAWDAVHYDFLYRINSTIQDLEGVFV